jgi:hypothetical protein
MNINDLKERISNAEENLHFCHNKHNQIMNEKIDYFDFDTYVFYNKSF